MPKNKNTMYPIEPFTPVENGSYRDIVTEFMRYLELVSKLNVDESEHAAGLLKAIEAYQEAW